MRKVVLLLSYTVSFCTFAYLPTYKYVQADSIHRTNEINPLLPSYYVVNEDRDVMIDGEMYDAKEVYALGGPIRYYISRIMPHVKGEALFSEITPASIAWRDKNMPLKISGLLTKATNPFDKEVKAMQERYLSLLEKRRNEICQIYNEYLRHGCDIKLLSPVCAAWRKVSSARYWRELKERQKNKREKAAKELSIMLEQGQPMDIQVTEAYAPIIDAKVARYKEYRQQLGVDAANEENREAVVKARREAAMARRDARDARQAAEAAEIKAEEARRRNWAWQNDPLNPINDPNNPQARAISEAMLIKMRRAEKERKREQNTTSFR